MNKRMVITVFLIVLIRFGFCEEIDSNQDACYWAGTAPYARTIGRRALFPMIVVAFSTVLLYRITFLLLSYSFPMPHLAMYIENIFSFVGQ